MNYGAVCPWCGEYWAFFKRMPVKGEPILATGVTLPDGKEPRPHSILVCQHCGKQIFNVPLNTIKPLEEVR